MQESTLSTALFIIVIVLAVLLVILSIYMIVAFRRIAITAKKLDYLIEDLSYKAEKSTHVIDSLVKLSHYIDTIDEFIKNDGVKVLTKTEQNKEEALKLLNQLRDFLVKRKLLTTEKTSI